MRMRMIHPSFWRDKRLAKLPPQQVLIYIGLWQLADDGGWLVMDLEEMAAELLPYRVRGREEVLKTAVKALTANGRIEVFDCGHAFIPKLSVYQTAGHPWYGIRERHKRDCSVKGANPSQSVQDSPSRVRESRVEESRINAQAHERAPGPGLKDRLGEFEEVVRKS